MRSFVGLTNNHVGLEAVNRRGHSDEQAEHQCEYYSDYHLTRRKKARGCRSKRFPWLESFGGSVSNFPFKGDCIGPASVLDDELVLSVFLRRNFHRTLRPWRFILADFLASRVGHIQVHVSVLRAICDGLELLPGSEGQDVGDRALVLHLDLLACALRSLA